MTELSRSRPDLSITYDDDPRVVEEQRAEDYSRHVVPETVRVDRFKLMMSSWSLLSALVWLFYGALVASLFGTKQAVIGIVVTAVTYAALNWLMATWGVRFGLNSLLLSRRMFGAVGAGLTALLIAANSTYYAVFESSVLAVALKSYVGALDIRVWYLIVVVAILPLMLGSVQSWMDKINAILLPVYIVGVVAAVIVAAGSAGAGPDWWGFAGVVPAEARAIPGWLSTVVLYMGIWLIMPTTVEFTRLAKPQDTRFHRNVTFGVGFFLWLFLLNGLAGIFLVQTMLPNEPAAEAGVVQALIATLGVWGVVLILATQTRINSLNYYLASINWERLFSAGLKTRLSRPGWVVVVAAAAYLLMLTDVFSYLQRALTWQGVFLVSWVGIVVTHLALSPADRASGPEFRPGRVKAFSPGLVVWVVSAAVGIWLTENPTQFPRLAALAPVVALALSVALYAAALKLGPSTLIRRASDLRDDVSDLKAARIACHVCDRSYLAAEMDRDPSAEGAPICNACGETSAAFLKAARAGL